MGQHMLGLPECLYTKERCVLAWLMCACMAPVCHHTQVTPPGGRAVHRDSCTAGAAAGLLLPKPRTALQVGLSKIMPVNCHVVVDCGEIAGVLVAASRLSGPHLAPPCLTVCVQCSVALDSWSADGCCGEDFTSMLHMFDACWAHLYHMLDVSLCTRGTCSRLQRCAVSAIPRAPLQLAVPHHAGHTCIHVSLPRRPCSLSAGSAVQDARGFCQVCLLSLMATCICRPSGAACMWQGCNCAAVLIASLHPVHPVLQSGPTNDTPCFFLVNLCTCSLGMLKASWAAIHCVGQVGQT